MKVFREFGVQTRCKKLVHLVICKSRLVRSAVGSLLVIMPIGAEICFGRLSSWTTRTSSMVVVESVKFRSVVIGMPIVVKVSVCWQPSATERSTATTARRSEGASIIRQTRQYNCKGKSVENYHRRKPMKFEVVETLIWPFPRPVPRRQVSCPATTRPTDGISLVMSSSSSIHHCCPPAAPGVQCVVSDCLCARARIWVVLRFRRVLITIYLPPCALRLSRAGIGREDHSSTNHGGHQHPQEGKARWR